MNHEIKEAHTNLEANMSVMKKLPEIENNGFTSTGFIEEELYNNYDKVGNVVSTEVWVHVYREVGGVDLQEGFFF